MLAFSKPLRPVSVTAVSMGFHSASSPLPLRYAVGVAETSDWIRPSYMRQ